MGDYFKPLRRKIGVMTLVLACVFAVGWVRSLSRRDLVSTGLGDSHNTIASMNQSVYFYRWAPLPLSETLFESTAIDPSLDPWKNVVSTDHIQFAGFGFANGHCSFLPERIKLLVWMVPYWSIVTPLTVLSAWLLLSKPRKSSNNKPAQPERITAA